MQDRRRILHALYASGAPYRTTYSTKVIPLQMLFGGFRLLFFVVGIVGIIRTYTTYVVLYVQYVRTKVKRFMYVRVRTVCIKLRVVANVLQSVPPNQTGQQPAVGPYQVDKL